MSADTTTLSPITRLAGNLPQLISGFTFSITTRFLPSSATPETFLKMNKHATHGVLLPELIDLIITDGSQGCRGLDPLFSS